MSQPTAKPVQSRREEAQAALREPAGSQRQEALTAYIRRHDYSDAAQWTLISAAIGAVSDREGSLQARPLVKDLTSSEAAPAPDVIDKVEGRALTNREDPSQAPLRGPDMRRAAVRILEIAEGVRLDRLIREAQAAGESLEDAEERVFLMHAFGNLRKALPEVKEDLAEALDTLCPAAGDQSPWKPGEAVKAALHAAYQVFEERSSEERHLAKIQAIDAVLALPKGLKPSNTVYGACRYGIAGENGPPRMNLLSQPPRIVDEDYASNQKVAA